MCGKASMRAFGLGLLAAAASAVSAQEENRSEVICRVVSASRTNIQSQDGYAEALVNIAESVCNEVAEEPLDIPINESIRAVAIAQAEAVAEVVSECAGVGSATLQVEASRRAEARATAVGNATAGILANAGVCSLCSVGLNSLVEAVQTLTAVAVTQLDLNAEITFTGEPLTVSVVATSVETQVASLLASVVGQARLSASGCSINAVTSAMTPMNSAMCDVAISADDVRTDIDASVRAGLEVQAFGCDGVDSFLTVQQKLREVAVAIARSVTQAEVFCDTMGVTATACGMASGTANSTATAHVEAFAEGTALASGEECDCEIAPVLRSREEVGAIIAQSTASSIAQICVERGENARVSDFQFEVEERVAEALAQVFIETFVGVDECAVNLRIVTDIGPTSAP